MYEIAYVIIAVLIIIIMFMGVRLWMYESQIKHIKDELAMLDKEDTNYRISSCCHVGKTEDMIEIDTTNMTPEQVIEKILGLVSKKGLGCF